MKFYLILMIYILKKAKKIIVLYLIYFILRLIRDLITIFYNPLIRYNIFKLISSNNIYKNEIFNNKLDKDIFLPLSHNLPLALARYPYYSSNLGRIIFHINNKYNDLKIIDIGANIGDSIIMSQLFCDVKLLCLEGEKKYYQILEKNAALFDNVKILNYFLGDREELINGKVSIQRGTAKVFEKEKSFEKIELKKFDNLIKEVPEFSNAKLIKIDTDGYDLKIIRGSIEFIKSKKPVLFFEYAPELLETAKDDGISTIKILFDLGYQYFIVYDCFGELLISIALDVVETFEDIHNYFSKRNSEYYCDICLINKKDYDLFNLIVNSERDFYRIKKRNKDILIIKI